MDSFRDLDRMTDQLLGAVAGSARVPRFMPMDLYRSGDHYLLHADLPGVDPGSIEVDVENSTLTLTAQRTARSEEGVQWIGSERPVGTFRRQISIGEGIDTAAITATYADGVLTLTIPVAERAKARRVQVTRAGDHDVHGGVPGDVQGEVTGQAAGPVSSQA